MAHFKNNIVNFSSHNKVIKERENKNNFSGNNSASVTRLITKPELKEKAEKKLHAEIKTICTKCRFLIDESDKHNANEIEKRGGMYFYCSNNLNETTENTNGIHALTGEKIINVLTEDDYQNTHKFAYFPDEASLKYKHCGHINTGDCKDYEEILSSENLKPLLNTKAFWLEIFGEAEEREDITLFGDNLDFFSDNTIEENYCEHNPNIFAKHKSLVKTLVGFFDTGTIKKSKLKKLISIFHSETFWEVINEYEEEVPQAIKSIGGIKYIVKILTKKKYREDVRRICNNKVGE